MTTLKQKCKTAQLLITMGFYAIGTEVMNLCKEGNCQKECNVCGWKGKNFYPFWNEICKQKDQTLCPRCHSSVYQRNLFKYLQENLEPNKFYNVMECSPHSSDPVRKVLKNSYYVSIDIVKGRAERQMDLTALAFKSNSFDIVVCSAVLEHVKDDVKALQEIYRVLKKNGRAIIEIPIGYYKDMKGEHTTEFNGMPFYEHHRAYGLDFIDKLDNVGFALTEIVKYHDGRLVLESPSLLGFYVGIK